MPLDIRRGFVRTWVVLSGLWIVGVIAVAAIEAARSTRTIDRFYYSLQLDRLAPSGSAQAESFPEWLFTERDFPEDGIALVLPRPEPKGLWSAWENITAAKQGAAVEKDENGPGEAFPTIVSPSAMPQLLQRAKRLQMRERIRKFGAVLTTALLPPALLLVVGLVVSRKGKGLLDAHGHSS